MKKFISYCLSHNISIDMLMIIIILIGTVSLYNLRLEILPVFDVPFVTIRVDTTDVSIMELEENVTEPLQRELSTLSGLKYLRSYTYSNQVIIHLEFQWGIEKNELLFDISSRIDRVYPILPDYANKPEAFLTDPSARPLGVYAIEITGQRESFNIIFESNIRQLFLQNKDIANFVYFGDFINEMHIVLDKERLNALGIDHRTVLNAISTEGDGFGFGSYILHEHRRYSIRLDPLIKDIYDLKSLKIPIGDNTFTELSEIGEFQYIESKSSGDIYLDGKEIILCEIYNRYDSNPIAVINDIDEKVQNWNENNEIQIIKLEDNSNLIMESINDIMLNAVIGGLIAFLVLFLFFNEIKYPLILMLSMPFSILIAFLFFYIGGISLNIISIGGLSIGIGLLVDNSVVVVENIIRYKKDRLNAVYDVFYPLLAGTITTIIVFFPVIYLRGLIGTFFIQQALAITIALLASLLIAFFIIPSLLKREINPPVLNIPPYTEILDKKKIEYFYAYIITFINYFFIMLIFIIRTVFFYAFTGIFRMLDRLFAPLARRTSVFWQNIENLYENSLRYLIGKRNIIIFVFMIFFLFNLYFVFNIDRAFIPEIPSDIIIVEILLPVGTSREHSRAISNEIFNTINEYEGIRHIKVHIGEEWTNTMHRRFNSHSNYMKIYLKEEYANDAIKQRHLMADISQRLQGFPDTAVSIQGVETIYGDIFSFGEYPYEINLYGDDISELSRDTESLYSLLRDSGYFSDISTEALTDVPLFRLRLNEDMIRSHDLRRDDILNSIRMILSGQNIDIEIRNLDINLRLHEENIILDDFLNEMISIDKNKFYIKELVDIDMESEPLLIQHFQSQRNTIIYARHHIELGYIQVLDKLEDIVSEFAQEKGILYEITGENIRIRDSFGDLIFAVALAVILVYISLGVILESYKMPIMIMTAIPMGLTGVFTGLFLLRNSINVFSMLGMVVLVGICVNDSILKISKAENFIKQGIDTESAIIKASIHKWRPILITSITTILGLFPLLFSQGRFAILAKSLALTVILGLTFSTLLTLYIIPLIYLIFKRK